MKGYLRKNLTRLFSQYQTAMLHLPMTARDRSARAVLSFSDLKKPSHIIQKPICNNSEETKSNKNIMKLYQPVKLEMMWNEAMSSHRKTPPECTGFLLFDEDAEKKFGLCWQERLKCNMCPYVSSMYKLYEEISTKKEGQIQPRRMLAYKSDCVTYQWEIQG